MRSPVHNIIAAGIIYIQTLIDRLPSFHYTMKQNNIPTLKDPPSSPSAPAEEMTPPPELEGKDPKKKDPIDMLDPQEEKKDPKKEDPPSKLQGTGREDEEEAKNIARELDIIFSEETVLRYQEDEMAAGSSQPRVPPANRNGRAERERLREAAAAAYEEETFSSDASSDMRPGAVAVGPTGPSVLHRPRVPSVISQQPSLIVAELAEPSQDDEVVRRRLQDLEKIVGEAPTATIIVENKRRRFLIGAALALLLVVGVILGVTIPLTTGTNNDKDISEDAVPTPAPIMILDIPSNDPVVTPTVTPSQSPTNANNNPLNILTEILLNNTVTDAEAFQNDTSPQFLALDWLANDDPALLDLDSTPPVILVERYALAVLYYATNGEDWSNELNFLSASSVCEWTKGGKGVAACNEDRLVVSLIIGKSKHYEVIVRMTVPLAHISLPFFLNRFE
jgi:hypothetical protein